MITIVCPNCNKKHHIADRFANRKIRCKRCQCEISVSHLMGESPNKKLVTIKIKAKKRTKRKDISENVTIADRDSNNATIVEQEGSNTESHPTRLEGDKLFSNYKIEKMLGQGGMGVVYKAYDTNLKRVVALKLISKEVVTSSQIERFVLEARSVAKLDHPHIVKIYEIGESPKHYFTMEYIAGKTLTDSIRQEELKLYQIVEIIRNISDALHTVHGENMIHRDIKPANIMLDKNNTPKLMDFGLAKVIDSQLSKTGDVLGTPAYMSPEQAESNHIDERSDIYSLGASLYEALTKRPPFQGESYFNIMHQVLYKDPISPSVLNPDIPLELSAICLKCLEKNRERRYKNAQEFTQELSNFLEDKPIIAKPPTIWRYATKFIARNRLMVSMIAAFFLLLTVGTLVYIVSIQRYAHALLIAKQNEQQQRIKIAKEARSAKVSLAKISLGKSIESHLRTEYQNAGTFALAALDFVASLSGNDIEEFRRQANHLTKWSVVNYGLSWQAHQHTSRISSMCFSPEGKILATISLDRHLKLWDTATGECTHTKNFSDQDKSNFLSFLKFSRNGQYLIALSYDRVILWNRQGNHLADFPCSKNADSIAISPNGDRLAVSSQDEIVLWDTTNKTQTTLTTSSNRLYYLNFSLDGKYLGGIFDKKLVVYDIATKQQISQISSEDKIFHYGFTNSNNIHMFTKTTWNVFNISGESIEQKLIYSDLNIEDIVFSADTETLGILQRSGEIIIRQPRKIYWRWQPQKHLTYFNIDEGGKFLALGYRDGSMEMYYIKPYRNLITSEIDQSIEKIEFDLTLQRLVYSTQNRKTHVVNLQNQQKIAEYDAYSFVLRKNGNVILAKRGNIEEHNLNNGEVVATIPCKSLALDMALSKDEKYLAVASLKKIATVWEVQNNYREFVSVPHKDWVMGVSFSQNNDKLLTCSRDHTAIVWDLQTQQKISTFQGHSTSVTAAIFVDPLGQIAASAALDNSLKLWETSSGKLLHSFTGHTQPIRCLQSVQEGSLVISASEDGTIRIWDTICLSEVMVIQEHQKSLRSFAVTPQGNILASCSLDQSWKLWDLSLFTAPETLPSQIDLFRNSTVAFHKASFFNFRSDFQGKAIEKLLQESPKKAAQILFRKTIDESLSIQDVSE